MTKLTPRETAILEIVFEILDTVKSMDDRGAPKDLLCAITQAVYGCNPETFEMVMGKLVSSGMLIKMGQLYFTKNAR